MVEDLVLQSLRHLVSYVNRNQDRGLPQAIERLIDMILHSELLLARPSQQVKLAVEGLNPSTLHPDKVDASEARNDNERAKGRKP